MNSDRFSRARFSRAVPRLSLRRPPSSPRSRSPRNRCCSHRTTGSFSKSSRMSSPRKQSLIRPEMVSFLYRFPPRCSHIKDERINAIALLVSGVIENNCFFFYAQNNNSVFLELKMALLSYLITITAHNTDQVMEICSFRIWSRLLNWLVFSRVGF